MNFRYIKNVSTCPPIELKQPWTPYLLKYKFHFPSGLLYVHFYNFECCHVTWIQAIPSCCTHGYELILQAMHEPYAQHVVIGNWLFWNFTMAIASLPVHPHHRLWICMYEHYMKLCKLVNIESQWYELKWDVLLNQKSCQFDFDVS